MNGGGLAFSSKQQHERLREINHLQMAMESAAAALLSNN